jgi:hypothetical protein
MIASRLLDVLASAVIAHAALISIPDNLITEPTRTRGSFPLPVTHIVPPSNIPELKVLKEPVVRLAEQQPSPTPILYNQIDAGTRDCRMVDKAAKFVGDSLSNNLQAAVPHDKFIVCPTTVETVVGEVDATPVATIYTTVVRLNA